MEEIDQNLLIRLRRGRAVVRRRLKWFYKKGCEEKSSASTGGPRLFPEIQPTLFRYPEDVWLVVPFS